MLAVCLSIVWCSISSKACLENSYCEDSWRKKSIENSRGHPIIKKFEFDQFHIIYCLFCNLVTAIKVKLRILVAFKKEVARWEIFMEQELRSGLDLGRMAHFPAFIASKSFDLWNHHIPQKCLYNLWHILMYQKYMKL